MSIDWKPGDVAMVRDPVYGDLVMLRIGGCWHGVEDGGGLRCLAADSAIGARPLVVIDPEDREQVERLLNRFMQGPKGDYIGNADDLQDALRSLIAPPKPDEPTGLGAVVEDTKGRRWTRADESGMPWLARYGGNLQQRRWHQIRTVRVLSEGVTP